MTAGGASSPIPSALAANLLADLRYLRSRAGALILGSVVLGAIAFGLQDHSSTVHAGVLAVAGTMVALIPAVAGLSSASLERAAEVVLRELEESLSDDGTIALFPVEDSMQSEASLEAAWAHGAASVARQALCGSSAMLLALFLAVLSIVLPGFANVDSAALGAATGALGSGCLLFLPLVNWEYGVEKMDRLLFLVGDQKRRPPRRAA